MEKEFVDEEEYEVVEEFVVEEDVVPDDVEEPERKVIEFDLGEVLKELEGKRSSKKSL